MIDVSPLGFMLIVLIVLLSLAGAENVRRWVRWLVDVVMKGLRRE